MKKARLAWAALLLLAVIPSGFVLGGWIGARLLVPDNAGLAGGAMVLWYGALGTLLALAAGLVAVRMLATARLKLLALIAALLASGVLVMASLKIAETQRERDADRQRTMTMLPPFTLVLAGNIGNGLRGFSYGSESNDWHARLADGRQCRGGLPGGKAGDRARVELLGALRGLDVAGVLVDPPACQRVGEVLATLDIEIRETRPPITAGRLQLTQACRDEIPEIEALFESVQAVYRRHRRELDCQ